MKLKRNRSRPVCAACCMLKCDGLDGEFVCTVDTVDDVDTFDVVPREKSRENGNPPWFMDNFDYREVPDKCPAIEMHAMTLALRRL